MSPYQRFMTALEGEEPDRVPIWELIVNRPVIQALLGDVSYPDFVEAMDLDAVTVAEDQMATPSDQGHRDEWGILWSVGGAGIPYPVSGPIGSEEDLEAYQPPDPHAGHRLASLAQAVARFKGRRAVVFLGHDSFEFACYLRGMGNLLMDFALDPHFASRVMDLVIDYKAAVMERAAEEGADVLLSGDDYAWRQAPIMSPKHFRRFVLPRLEQDIRVAKREGLPFIKHTDGQIWPILDMMVEAGISALHPIEPIAGMDIGEVKQTYPEIALAGNVDCTHLLPHGSEQEVVEAVKETIAKASPGGGHILSSSNSIHPGVKPENYRAMVQAGRRFGRYPLDPEMVREYGQRNYMARYLAAGSNPWGRPGACRQRSEP